MACYGLRIGNSSFGLPNIILDSEIFDLARQI